MKPLRYRLLFLFIIVAGLAVAQTPTASPKPAESSPSGVDTINLEVYQEGGGLAVQMQPLFNVVKELYPDARTQWDPVRGIMRFEADGQTIDILTRRSAIVVNKRIKTLPRPVSIYQTRVSVPIETAQVLFDALHIDFNLTGNSDRSAEPDQPDAPAQANPPAVPDTLFEVHTQGTPRPSPTPTPTPTPVETPAILLTPEAAATPAPAPTPDRQIAAATAPGAPANAAASGAPPALEAPAGLTTKIGLTWKQLADPAHRTPPQRLTLILDRDHRAIGEQISRALQVSGWQVTVIGAPTNQRDTESIVNSVQETRPDLLIDLVTSPSTNEQAEGYVIWTVNDALWPQDRDQGKTPATLPQLRYLRHQFQSLALGSLLRSELTRRFQPQPVTFELAPSFLLRRIDAPAAVILLPTTNAANSDWQGKLSEAISGAASDYRRGMEQAGS